MALTPFLNEVGRKAAEIIDEKFEGKDVDPKMSLQKVVDTVNFDATDPVVILGFGQMGQVLANFLSTPLASGLDGDFAGWPYAAFDLDPGVVKDYSMQPPTQELVVQDLHDNSWTFHWIYGTVSLMLHCYVRSMCSEDDDIDEVSSEHERTVTNERAME